MCAQFSNIAVVLVKPAGDLNIGSAARAMKNTGFPDMALVDPVDHLTPDAMKMAASSQEILDKARCFQSLNEALKDRRVVFGITARPRHKRPRITPDHAARLVGEHLDKNHKIALVFGPEDKGLSTEDINLCTHLVGITADPELTSFNLAQAVLLICHAIFSRVAPSLAEGAEPVLCTQEDRNRIEEQILDLLKRATYLTPSREHPIKDMVSRLTYQADLESRDVRNILAAIRHITIQLEKSSGEQKEPT